MCSYNINRLKVATIAALLLAPLILGGCASVGYYKQLLDGHWQLMSARESIDSVIADPDTAGPLKAQLQRVHDIRAFASGQLDWPETRAAVWD